MSKPFRNGAIAMGATLLTLALNYFVADSFGETSFVFSWTLHFTLMAWYTALVALSVPKLNSRYFNSYRFEQEGRIYEYLGVHFYRKLLVWTGWEKVSRKANPIRKDLASLTTADRNSRTSEAGHLVIAVIVFAVAGLVMRSWSEARWLLVLNVVLNIYPVLLQRFNRPRYRRVLVALQKNAAVQNKHGSLIK